MEPETPTDQTMVKLLNNIKSRNAYHLVKQSYFMNSIIEQNRPDHLQFPAFR